MGLFSHHRRRNPYRRNPYERDDPAEAVDGVLEELSEVPQLQQFLADVRANPALRAQLIAMYQSLQDRIAAEVEAEEAEEARLAAEAAAEEARAAAAAAEEARRAAEAERMARESARPTDEQLMARFLEILDEKIAELKASLGV